MNNFKKIFKEKIKEINKKYFLNKVFFYETEKSEIKNYELKKIFWEIDFTWKILDNPESGLNWIIVLQKISESEKNNFLKKISYEGFLFFLDENLELKIIQKEWISKKFLEILEKKLSDFDEKNFLDKKNFFLEKKISEIFKEEKSKKQGGFPPSREWQNGIPKKTFILKAYQKFLENWEIKKSEILEKFLVRKKIRSLSW